MSRKGYLWLTAVCAAICALALVLHTTRSAGPAPKIGNKTHRLGAGQIRPVVSGLFGGVPASPVVGNTFTSSSGTWLNTPTSFTYQWEDCDGNGNNCTPITSATNNTYTVVSNDVGSTLRSTVGACNAYGCVAASAASTSAATGSVAASGAVPVNSTAPTVSGVPVQGQVLTATTGTWSGAPSSYAYQWQDCDSAGANCSNVASGGTSSTYTLVSGDNGSTLEVGVKATNGNGQSASATSSAATNVAAPSTLGKTAVGGTCTDGLASNFERVNEYTLASTSTVDSINAYLQPSGTVGSQQIQGVIYADNGSSAPGAFVAKSSAITFTNGSSTGWYSLPFTPKSLNAGNYWIGLFTGTSTGIANYCYDVGAGNLRAGITQTFTSGPADPFGTPSYNAFVFSIYLGYAAGTQSTPTAPTNLAATAGDTTASLTWTASTETGGTISSYQVFRSTSPTSGFSQVGTSTNTTFSDSGLTDGTTYYWFVKAVDALSVVSGQSNTANATPQSPGTPLWQPTLSPTCGGSTFWSSINPAVANTTGGTVNNCVTDPGTSGTTVIEQSVTSGTLGFGSHPRIDWNGVGAIPFDGTGDVYISLPVYLPSTFPCSQASSSGSYINLMKVFGNPGTGGGPLSLAAAESSTGCSTWAIEGNTSGTNGGGVSLLYNGTTAVNDATWHDWIFHLVLNGSASTGEVQAWEDGSPVTFNKCTNSAGKLSGCGTTTLNYTTLIPSGNDAGKNYVDVQNSRSNTTATFTDTAFFGPPAIANTFNAAKATLVSYPNGP